MSRILALLVLGASIALTGATAFAESDAVEPMPMNTQAPQVITPSSPVYQGTLAGGSGPSVNELRWHEQEGRL